MFNKLFPEGLVLLWLKVYILENWDIICSQTTYESPIKIGMSEL